MFGKEITSRASQRENDLPSPGGQPWAQMYIKLAPLAIHPAIGASYGLIWWMLEVGTFARLKGFQRDWNCWGGRIRNYFQRKFHQIASENHSAETAQLLKCFFGNKIFVTAEDVNRRFALAKLLMNLIQSERLKMFLFERNIERQVFRSFGDGCERWFMREMWWKRNEAQKAGWNSGFRTKRAFASFGPET